MKDPEYILHLRPLKHWQAPEQRLRALLKRALRNHAFQCTSCKPVPTDQNLPNGK
jgi:hypothetical protein